MARKYTKHNTAYWESKAKKQKEDDSQNNMHQQVKGLYAMKQQDLGEDSKHMRPYEVDGKNRRDEADIQKARELEELIGIKKSNPFGTLDKDIFAASLEEKTKTDLQTLCHRVGIPTRSTVEATKESLKKEFRNFLARHGAGIPCDIRPAVDPNSPQAEELKKILEG